MYDDIIPTSKLILEAVDEYTLYCFYTGIDGLVLGRTYNSPYREDPCPSFCVFKTNKYEDVEYMWKDHGNGDNGSIFKLIQKIEGLSSRQEAFARINEDFALGFDLQATAPTDKVALYDVPQTLPIKISIAPRPLSDAGLEFWQQFQIDEELLNFYNWTQIKWYWSYVGQETPYTVPDPTFANRIGAHYQIYSPYASKVNKFRNDLPEDYFFGYLQLPPTGERLIIDKSAKDVTFCRRLGEWAVSGKSETIMIPEKKMLELRERFNDNVFLMLDPDQAGITQTEKYMSKYPWLKPRFLTQAKDKTDLCKAVGFEEAERIVKNLLQ